MDQDCANNACKTKLREFREINGKLYDEIYSLEDDIKEKDAFAEKVVRQKMTTKKKWVCLTRKLMSCKMKMKV